MYGNKYATAFFMTRADFTTCGKNIFPLPNKSPTTFIPVIKFPSITSIGLSASCLACSTSSTIYWSIPFTKARVILFCNGSSRHDKSILLSFVFPTTDSAKSSNLSVASSLLFNITSSTRSSKSLGISSYTSSILGFTIPMFIPAFIAWYKKTECIASRTGLLPLNEKETLLTPPLTLAYGKFSRTHFVAFIKSRALSLCSSIPVATGKILRSKMISSGAKPTLSTSTSYERFAISIRRS